MKYQIGTNEYTVDLFDDKSIEDAVASEIKYQHKVYGIVDDNIHVSSYDEYNKDTKKISYYVGYDTYLTHREIVGYGRDSTIDNINNLIKKVIKKCEEKRKVNIEKATASDKFKKFIISKFESFSEDISFETYIDDTVAANITNHDGDIIKVRQDYSIVAPKSLDEMDVIRIVRNLLGR